MNPDIKIAFIGGGNMGRALVGGLRGGGHPAAKLAIGDPHEATCEALRRDYPGVQVGTDNLAAIADADIVVLAIKPQELAQVVTAMQPALRQTRPVVLSIAAGLRTADLAGWCGAGIAIVRAMPNRPALVGAGATGLYAPADTPPAARALAEEVMRAAGTVAWVDDESLMDVVTAVSGSGPAYFFLLAEALTEAGIRQGLAAEAARQLAVATLHGAGSMAARSDGDLSRLRAEVTSRGGTTEAALQSLHAQHFGALVDAAVEAAVRRGRELAAEFGTHRS
ncbi:MAG: pyrroline-5-carboxylate reductase [Steroidobacteraceae bacterium]|nr:pyrroline-5-carboxylate reductase [Nevskiaceae bacterium]MCP5339794.1 pyrroline-5-carboxylate reductase [Nevskiaceae bacterium]MCP5360338.1 pyrroline-5-carboxylate reductase [Nevskiaceae bacterium]MCP5467264.1 pyrroline-5-carboxylate reductase [Nevskiaceae bacterium]MCP5471161.1 pyrroline-5-carboxylate reductase [Nevskiaceae bacterium]